MSEYIDQKDIVKWIDDSLEKCGHRYSNDMITMMEMFRTVINDCIPAADVREVVYCRDCKAYGEMLAGYDERVICHKFALTTKPNDFCSHGEKREES